MMPWRRRSPRPRRRRGLSASASRPSIPGGAGWRSLGSAFVLEEMGGRRDNSARPRRQRSSATCERWAAWSRRESTTAGARAVGRCSHRLSGETGCWEAATRVDLRQAASAGGGRGVNRRAAGTGRRLPAGRRWLRLRLVVSPLASQLFDPLGERVGRLPRGRNHQRSAHQQCTTRNQPTTSHDRILAIGGKTASGTRKLRRWAQRRRPARISAVGVYRLWRPRRFNRIRRDCRSDKLGKTD